MICNWCEEENKLISYCNNNDHKVCEECYDKYRTMFPERLEGCPYCIGTQEKVIVYTVPRLNHHVNVVEEPIPCEVLICLTICSIICVGIIFLSWIPLLIKIL